MNNVGAKLKKIRQGLNLTQKEMAGDILSVSYYSKVERELFDINTGDLLKILELHNISIVDFFNQSDDENLFFEYLVNQLRSAYYSKNLKLIDKLESKLNDLNSSSIRVQSLRMKILVSRLALSDSFDSLSNHEVSLIKRSIFLKENLDEEDLRLFAIAMKLFSVEELTMLVNSMIKTIDKTSCSNNCQTIILAIIVNYLSLTTTEDYRKSNREENEKMIYFLINLPQEPQNCFAKIMGQYYKAIVEEDTIREKEIINFIESCGMGQIAKLL